MEAQRGDQQGRDHGQQREHHHLRGHEVCGEAGQPT